MSWKRFGLVIALLVPFGTGAKAQTSAAIAPVVVNASVSETAIVDWNLPINTSDPSERIMITEIFRAAVLDTASQYDFSGRRAQVNVVVQQFDILSSIEIFFCCAVNEVAAIYELVDADSGEVLKPAELINFNHFGRGGVFAALAAAEGNDQLSRLNMIIREGTADWLAQQP
ncbi:MAG: DUF6778 family protein [Pseudomonadota bacterium]